MNDIEKNSSKEIRLKKILARLHYTVQQMSELFESQNKLFNMFVRCTQNDLNNISSIFQFLHDEHIKDYRKFTIKKVHDEAKHSRRKENEY